MTEYVEVASIEAIDETLMERSDNGNGNATDNVTPDGCNIEFPTSRGKLADFFGIQKVSVGRWVKELEESGIKVTNRNNEVTQEGFQILCEYRESGDRKAFINQYIQTCGDDDNITVAIVVPQAPTFSLTSNITSLQLKEQEKELEALKEEVTTAFEELQANQEHLDKQSENHQTAAELRKQKIKMRHAIQCLRFKQELKEQESAILGEYLND